MARLGANVNNEIKGFIAHFWSCYLDNEPIEYTHGILQVSAFLEYVVRIFISGFGTIGVASFDLNGF